MSNSMLMNVSIIGASLPLVAVRRLVVQKERDDILQIEAFLQNVRTIRHPGILGLLAYRMDRLDALKTRVTMCSEYADRGTLRELLRVSSLKTDRARHWTILMLEALDFLHHHGLAHGNISSSSVYLHGNAPMTPRLGHLGKWRLQDVDESPLPARWKPQGLGSDQGRRTADIWQLGILVLQMFLDPEIIEQYSSPEALLGRRDLTEAFEDFLRKVFADTRRRPSAFDLLPAEFLRSNAEAVQRACILPVRLRRQSSSITSAVIKRRSRHNSSYQAEATFSRYAADFTEMGRLGKGGFGEVVKARNKLDGGVYAIKKIKQAPQLLDQVLSEVMLLNRLNHPYVVRYFSTWLESDASVPEDAISTTEEATTEDATDDTASDSGPRVNVGYQSTGGFDFVSSSGYPQIEFGEDDDDASEDEATGNDILAQRPNEESALGSAETSDTGLALRRSRSDTQPQRSTLYIQMEYCERQTLRDLVWKGMSDDDSWRYVRQITEGLAHIHSHGIIHRDLKPDNVFIDVAGNPKIGDFGLATTTQYHLAERAVTMSGHSGGGDMTRSVGTALYVAPELRSGGGTYNDKVDMYSLGVMFFEMCEHFGTAMERIRALQQIRERVHELPAAYRANGNKAAQGKLIDCLISHKPSERPSSTELLRSEILPIKIEDETIRQALSGLTDPRSPYHQKMMSALFSQDASGDRRVKAMAWDANATSTPDDATKLRLRAVAMQKLKSVFRRHGAEEIRRETVFPRSGYYTGANVVQLLDASGNLLQLPYDLTLPHARMLARQTPFVKRSFIFGSAYRDAFTGGAPHVSDEVDFDVIQLTTSEDSALDDAEVMKVMDEIVCELPTFTTSTTVCFYLNHSGILDAILEHCRVPLPQQDIVKDTISRLGFHQWTWAKVRTELRKLGLPDTTLDDLEQFDFREPTDKAMAHLDSLLGTASSRTKASYLPGARALQAILECVEALGLQRKLYIVPLASVNAKLYEGGMLFQCVLERKANRTVIAAGGRYDSLIRAHKAITTSKTCEGAVGVAIGLDSIVAHMARSAGQTGKKAFLQERRKAQAPDVPKRCDVLVETGPTDGSTAAGLRLLRTLWANDISAELAGAARSLVAPSEHSFIIGVRHEASTTVRVTKAGGDDEGIDVPIASLVSHIHQDIRERESTRTRPSAFTRHTSHHEAERKSNVHVLMAQHRSKKTNKFHIVDAAQQKWEQKIEEWKGAPILAVETTDNVLESIRCTRLGDAESWRKAVQGVPLNERQYVGQIQGILTEWRKLWLEEDGSREACIFNFRTGGCIYYDLGM